MSRDGMRTLRKSAEKIPPSFMTPLLLILRDTERRGCLKWNSLGGDTSQNVNLSVPLADNRWGGWGGAVLLLWWGVLGPAGPVNHPVGFFIQRRVVLSGGFWTVLPGLETRQSSAELDQRGRGLGREGV